MTNAFYFDVGSPYVYLTLARSRSTTWSGSRSRSAAC